MIIIAITTITPKVTATITPGAVLCVRDSEKETKLDYMYYNREYPNIPPMALGLRFERSYMYARRIGQGDPSNEFEYVGRILEFGKNCF